MQVQLPPLTVMPLATHVVQLVDEVQLAHAVPQVTQPPLTQVQVPPVMLRPGLVQLVQLVELVQVAQLVPHAMQLLEVLL